MDRRISGQVYVKVSIYLRLPLPGISFEACDDGKIGALLLSDPSMFPFVGLHAPLVISHRGEGMSLTACLIWS